MARTRQRAHRRILKHMARYRVSRTVAERQLRPILSAEESARYTARRLTGTLPKWEPGRRRGWVSTIRPRDRQRQPGTTPEAQRRRRWRALRNRRERAAERLEARRERLERTRERFWDGGDPDDQEDGQTGW